MGKENRRYGQTRGRYPLQIHNTESEAARPKHVYRQWKREASWQIDGETVEAVANFIFLGSQITVDGD